LGVAHADITPPDYLTRLKEEIISFHKGNFNTTLLVFTGRLNKEDFLWLSWQPLYMGGQLPKLTFS